MTVKNIPGELFVNLEFLRLGQLLEAGADCGDLAVLGHLQGVLEAPDEGDGQLSNVINVGEDRVQLRVRRKLQSLNLFPEHFCDHVKITEVGLLGHDEIPDHLIVCLGCSAPATFKEFSN